MTNLDNSYFFLYIISLTGTAMILSAVLSMSILVYYNIIMSLKLYVACFVSIV